MLNGKPVLYLPWRKVCHLRPVGRKPPPRRAMVPRASQAMVLVLMVISPAARALTTTTSSSETSDPSCATLQVAAASTARSFPDCPAVLVSVTLTASTEDCATDIQMSMEMEEYPRDVNTFGGESSAALEDKTITWSAPALTASTSLSVEFRLDLCGFCDTYDNGKFNPIDSFQYQDAEGNEPNDRKKGYQLKLDCEGIEGDPVESIVATPAPVLPATPAPVVATMSPVTTPGPTELEAATPAPKPTTAAPEAVETVAPSSLKAAPSSEAPVGTPAPVEATMAPLATRAPAAATPEPTELEASAPTVVLTMAPSSSTDTVAPSSIGAVPSSAAPVGTPAPVEATTAPLATEAPAAATPGPTELEVITPSPVSATAPPVATATGAPSAIEATPRSVAPVGTPAPADTTAATPEPTELKASTPSPVSATVSPVATATGAPSSIEAVPSSAAPVRTPAPVDTTTPPIASQAPAAATPEPTETEAITSAPVSATLPPVATATDAPSSLGAAPPSAAPVGTPAPVDTTTPPIATQAPAPATPEPTELEVITSAPASTTAPPVATATGAPSSLGAPAPSVAPVGTPAPVDATTAPRATQAPAPATPEPTEPAVITSAPVSATAPPVATVTGAPSSLGAAPPSAAPVGSPAPTEADPRATRAPEAFILAPPETGDGATPAPTGADRGIGGAPSSSLASSASSTTSAEGGESLTSSTSSGSASERQGSSAEESIAESDGTGTGSSTTTSSSSISSISSISSTGVSDGASGEGSRGISSESYGSASDGASTAAPTSVGSTVATTVGSTAAPSLGSSDGSRGYFFSASPTTAPTGAPTSLGGESLQGVTLEIQSIFEARRRALAADVSNDVLERRALSAVYAEDAEEYDEEMVDVCASLVGVPREDIISVSTDFGPDGPAEDAGGRRRGLMTSSSSEESGATATQLTPITTCEVDLSDASDTRAMTAATMVDRMLLPENFVLMMNANQYGPVNAAVTSISFWQNECPADACPAVGDGSFAAVFPVDSTLENQSSMVEDDDSEGKKSLFWFVVVAAVLTMFAVLTWCSFCLCCGGSTKRRRRPKETPEDLYTVKSPTEDNLVKSPLRKQRFATQVVVESDEYPSTGTPPGPSPTTPPRTRPKSNRRRAPPPPLSSSPRAMARRDARIAEPLSPGEADWRKKFGLGPLRDYTLRSAPVSPRRTTPTGSGGSTKTSSTDPFFGAYPDNVVAAADGKRKLVLPPLMDDATAAMESQSTWQISDEMNANVQHSIDPVVRSSLSKAGVMVANALTSPRRELNRLKEALNKPSRLNASPSISPTVTASSADPSSAPGFGGSEGGFSPGSNYGNNQFASSHFNNVNVSSPIYEIDLEAEENGGAAAGNAGATGAAGDSDGHDGRVGQATVVVTRGMSGEEEGATPSPSSSTSTRKSGRNPFAKAPGSVSSRGSSRGPPSSPSDMSTSTDRSETNAGGGGGGGGAFSTLATAAAVAEAKVGVMSPTGRAVHALASAGGAGGSDDTGFRDTGESHAVGSSGVLSSDPAGGGAEPHATKSFPKPLEGEEEGKSPYPASAVRVPSPGRYGGASSGFGCLAPQLSPRVACSRLPEIDDDDEDEDEDAKRSGGGGNDRVGHEATSSGQRPSLTLSLPGSASARGGSDLMPIAEAAGKEFFTDSDTESEISSRASSLSSARSGARRTPRDPAALLAAALQRAGQVAAIPPPSTGSPGQIGKPLSSVQEVPMEAIPLPGLYTPTATACSTPGQCAGGSCWGGEEGAEELPCPSPRAAGDEAVTPIPSPASRPGGLVYGVNGGAGESVKVTSPAGRSPARSREEAEDEREEHRVWERAMGYNTAGAAAGGGGAQELVSPSETIGGLGQGAAAAASSGSPLERDSAPLEEVAGAGAPGFSLVGTLVAFFGRKRGEVAPPAIPEKAVSRAAPIHVPEDSESSDFMQSPESHAVETWPDAIVEDGSKSSLDEGFVDVPVADVEIEDEADDEVVFKLPQKETPVDLPALVVPDYETGDLAEHGQRVFNRASMNLQSPGPELARTPEDAPMPALPKQPSPSVSMASSAMKTPVTGTNPSRISEASPMYDREAIAKAMSQAHADLDDDKGSDVILPSGAWPSERRQKPYIAGSSSSSSSSSDITSSSGSSYTGSGSTSSGSSSSGGNASARGSNNTHRF